MWREWLDNPLFIKHARSRLRPQGLTTSIAITVLICLCIMYGSYQTMRFMSGGAFTAFVILQFLILGVMGSTQAGSSIGAARTTGILDFHRVSPQTPLELTLGFLFGAPVREYLLAALILPFMLLCCSFGNPELRGLVQAEVFLLFVAWTLHAMAFLGGLVMKGAVTGQSALGITVMVAVFVVGPLVGAFQSLNTLIEADVHLNFFRVPCPGWPSSCSTWARCCTSCCWGRPGRCSRPGSTA